MNITLSRQLSGDPSLLRSISACLFRGFSPRFKVRCSMFRPRKVHGSLRKVSEGIGRYRKVSEGIGRYDFLKSLAEACQKTTRGEGERLLPGAPYSAFRTPHSAFR